MQSMNVALALLLLALTGSSLSAEPADASQESKTRQIKIWTNDDIEQLLSQGFTLKVPSEKVWSNADLLRFRDEGVVSKASAEKVWTNSGLEQRLSQPPVARKPGERVWTKPDLYRLRDQGLISVIGPVEESLEPGEQPWPYSETKDPEWYAAQAVALHAELDHRQAELQRFLQGLHGALNNEHLTNGVNLSEAVIGITPDSAIQFLERRVQDTQGKLDHLEDLARRNGIEPGVLRVGGSPAP
jgi:hypothetical protein